MQQFILPVTSLRWLHWRFSALWADRCEPPQRSPAAKTALVLAPRVGLEPTTNRLTAGCSTIELSGINGILTPKAATIDL